MPACTACGNHLSTDYLHAFGDNEGTLDGCPRCYANWAELSRRPMTDGSGKPNAGGGGASSPRTPTLESRDGAPGDVEPSGGLGGSTADVESSTDDESAADDGSPGEGGSAVPAFAVKTAGRSLERPRGPSDAERSGADWASRRSPSTGEAPRPRTSRDRLHAALASVLDALR